MGFIPSDEFDADAVAKQFVGASANNSSDISVQPKGWWTPDRISQAVTHLQKNANLSPLGAQGLVSRWAHVEAT